MNAALMQFSRQPMKIYICSVLILWK